MKEDFHWLPAPGLKKCGCRHPVSGHPVQALTPQITENKRKTEDLLREAYTLQACLQQRSSAAVLEKLLPKRYKQYMKGIGAKQA